MTFKHRQFEMQCLLAHCGQLSDEDFDRLREHVQECLACRKRLAEMAYVNSELLVAHKSGRVVRQQAPQGSLERFVERAMREGVPLTPSKSDAVLRTQLRFFVAAASVILLSVIVLKASFTLSNCQSTAPVFFARQDTTALPKANTARSEAEAQSWRQAMRHTKTRAVSRGFSDAGPRSNAAVLRPRGQASAWNRNGAGTGVLTSELPDTRRDSQFEVLGISRKEFAFLSKSASLPDWLTDSASLEALKRTNFPLDIRADVIQAALQFPNLQAGRRVFHFDLPAASLTNGNSLRLPVFNWTPSEAAGQIRKPQADFGTAGWSTIFYTRRTGDEEIN